MSKKKSKEPLTNNNNNNLDERDTVESPRKRVRMGTNNRDMNDANSTPESPKITPSKQPRLFHDAVHGAISMHPLLVSIIDTPQFQRLRDIKQLGGSYWVYPGASHTRFEHSIGTSYLCGRMLSTLRDLHKNVYTDDPICIIDKLNKLITNEDIMCVKIAGLCHDLGHGPFSHAFDANVLKKLPPHSDSKHEDRSCKLFKDIMENEEIKKMCETYEIKTDQQKKIETMILGKGEFDTIKDDKGQSYQKEFLYEIVANASTGIDCDKFDYIARDTHHIGMKNSFDFERYFQSVRIMVVDNKLKICARDKEEANLYELFHTRWTLHRQVYQHKTANLVEEMISSAIVEVNELFGISSSVDDMEKGKMAKYTLLTDSILYRILLSEDNSESTRKAKAILNRVQTRKLYDYCGQINGQDMENEKGEIKLELQKDGKEKLELLKEGIKAECKDIGEDEIFVNRIKFDFGKNGSNPLEQMWFFGKDDKQPKKREKLSDFMGIMPKNFEKESFMVYCTNSTKTKMVKDAFTKWCSKNKLQK